MFAVKLQTLLCPFFIIFELLSVTWGIPILPHHSRHIVEDISVKHEARAADLVGGPFFSVLGAAGVGDGTVHPRLEIRQLQQNTDQWNVYLLGLSRFQRMSQSDKLSYYQIAGIHGRPFISWDSVSQASGGGGGYCAHSSNLFPTWHRPYLALFEEILYLNARQVISEFPAGDLKDRYNSALSTLRMPYYDWAMVPPAGQGSMPASLQLPFIDVIMPNGTVTIPNPLFSYTFHPLVQNELYDSGQPKYSYWNSTLRDPTNLLPNATSRNDLVANQMDQIRANLQQRLYHVLTMETAYTDVSNDLSSDDSMESMHDTVHNVLGSSGHMTDIPWSAFDPVFWLHHAMVDRCFALWQALNPTSYVQPSTQIYATFSSSAGTVMDADYPLKPFHQDDQGKFWTSNTARSTSIFGYTYPELMNSNDTTALAATLNNLYGSNASPSKQNLEKRLHSIAGAASFASRRQYLVNIKAQKFGLGESFSTYIFLGNGPTSDPSDWGSDPSFVGLNGVFATASAPTGMANVETNGIVPLTAALEAHLADGDIANLNENDVGEYLKSSLHWRVKTANNVEIPADSVPGLNITVLWSEVRPASSHTAFPKKVGAYNILEGVTPC